MNEDVLGKPYRHIECSPGPVADTDPSSHGLAEPIAIVRGRKRTEPDRIHTEVAERLGGVVKDRSVANGHNVTLLTQEDERIATSA